MRSRILALAALPALAITACETSTPTQPSMDAIQAAPVTSSSLGVQFRPVVGPLTLASFTDEAFNSCEIGFSAQEGGHTRSDFYRDNKDGTLTVHTEDKAASFLMRVDGVTYEGTGNATASATLNAEGTAYVRVVVKANGMVSEGSGSWYNARCSGRGRNAADFQNVVISLH
ncbi:MAG: hypothetical protein PVJ02_18105 [Gemmatimonadota bacterium]